MSNAEFRAWDEQAKVMHHDFQYIKSGDDGNDWIIFTSDKQKLTDEPHPLQNPHFSQQMKISQFIGITDRNGKKIFEGDVVSVFSDGEYQFDQLVKYNNAATGALVDAMPNREYNVTTMGFAIESEYYQYEVIGNIYENPDIFDAA